MADDVLPDLCSALCHPHRLIILKMLTRGVSENREIRKKLGIQPSMLVQHMTKLTAAGLITSEQSGKYVNHYPAPCVDALIRGISAAVTYLKTRGDTQAPPAETDSANDNRSE